MLDLLETAYKGLEEHYQGLLEQHGRAYQRSFTKLISFLGHDVSLTSQSSADKVHVYIICQTLAKTAKVKLI